MAEPAGGIEGNAAVVINHQQSIIGAAQGLGPAEHETREALMATITNQPASTGQRKRSENAESRSIREVWNRSCAGLPTVCQIPLYG